MLLLFTPAAPTQHALTPPSTSTDPGTARMAAAARADALRTTVYSFPGNSTPAGYMPEPAGYMQETYFVIYAAPTRICVHASL